MLLLTLWTRISEDNIKTSYEKKYVEIDRSVQDLKRTNSFNKSLLSDLENKKKEYSKFYWNDSKVIKEIDKDIQILKDKIK